MKIKLNTTFTPYTKDSIIKPKHPLWMIKNNGTKPLLVNDDFVLQGTYGLLGVDALKILIPVIQHFIDTGGKEEIEIVNDTQFTITGLVASEIDYTLIETSIQIVQ